MNDKNTNAPTKNPLKLVLRFIWTPIKFFLLSVGVFFTSIPVLIFIAILSGKLDDKDSATSTKESFKKLKIVRLELDGTLIERPPSLEDQIANRLFGGPKALTFSSIRTTLRTAASDQHVKGLLVKLGNLHASNSQLEELRKLLSQFKETGKKIFFWAADFDSYNYLLATSAHEISLSPAGGMMIPGPVFQLVYFGDGLRKLGVQFEVVRAGKYKSAFEPLVLNQPSPEVVVMYQSMEKSIRDYLIQEIAASREKETTTVDSWLKQSMYTSNSALADGLVDRIDFYPTYEEQINTQLKEEFADEDMVVVSAKKYLKKNRIDSDDNDSGDKGIGLIHASGEIVMEGSDQQEEHITPEGMRKQIKWAQENEDIMSVVIRVNSPGGSATASDLIWNDIKTLASKKPVVVSFSSVAASGGYYISAAANKIFAQPSTITGSIGVIGAIPNLSQFKEKYGISFHIITQSERSQLLNPGEPTSAFDKALLESTIDTAYQLFIKRVSDGRKKPMSEVHDLAQGRVYTGIQALELGLVDEMGGITEAYQEAKKLGGLDPEKLYPIYQYTPDEISLRDCLKGMTKLFKCIDEIDSQTLIQSSYAAVRVSLPLTKFEAKLNRLYSITKEDHSLALWFGNYVFFESAQ